MPTIHNQRDRPEMKSAPPCSICLEPVSKHEAFPHTCACSGTVHYKCIQQWVFHKHKHGQEGCCPTCRAPITKIFLDSPDGISVRSTVFLMAGSQHLLKVLEIWLLFYRRQVLKYNFLFDKRLPDLWDSFLSLLGSFVLTDLHYLWINVAQDHFTLHTSRRHLLRILNLLLRLTGRWLRFDWCLTTVD